MKVFRFPFFKVGFLSLLLALVLPRLTEARPLCPYLLSELYASVVSQADLDLIEQLNRDPVIAISRPKVTRSIETPIVLELKSGKKLIFKDNLETTRTSGMRKEVAAFLFDRLLKTNLVPLTIIRIEGEVTGSAQFFIEGVHRTDRLYKTPAMRVFDFLIDTFDRTPENVVWSEKNRAYAIDHGFTFNVAKTAVCPSPTYQASVLDAARKVPGLMHRLKNLQEAQIRAILEPLVGEAPTNQVLERKTWLVQEFGKLGAEQK
jgi:hypothetical protein